jgi:hypothetical protein
LCIIFLLINFRNRLKNQLNVLFFSFLFFSNSLLSQENQGTPEIRQKKFNENFNWFENEIMNTIRQGNFNKDYIESIKWLFGSDNMQNIFKSCVFDEDIPQFKEVCDSFFDLCISKAELFDGKISYNDASIILYWAATYGRIKFIKYLSDNSMSSAYLPYKDALCKVLQASKKYDDSLYCYMQVLDFLVPKFVDINHEHCYCYYDFKYHTPLMIAATFDQPELVLWLLLHGANPDLISSHGDSKGESFISIANKKPRIMAAFDLYKNIKNPKILLQ